MNTLFRISKDIIDIFDWGDVDDTYKDMKEMGLDKAPYDNFAIEMSVQTFTKSLFKITSYYNEQLSLEEIDYEGTSVLLKYDRSLDEKGNDAFEFTIIKNFGGNQTVDLKQKALQDLVSGKNTKEEFAETAGSAKQYTEDMFKFLVVLLATKNTEKNQMVDKDLARGRYNKSKAYRKDYPITTTITIGKITETHKSEHGGGTVRPHLRRGHIRTQKYGPKYELSRRIFIEPVFVNADEGWIAERRAYNVKAA